nr:hypothetical protein Clen_218 [Cedratvirus lena]
MEPLSDQVCLSILESTDVLHNLETFIKLRYVCKLFYHLSAKIGTHIPYSYETLRALSPHLAQATNHMRFKKFICKDILVPEKVTSLELSSGDSNVTISGNHLQKLVVGTHHIELFLSKLRFNRVDTLEIGDLLEKEQFYISSVRHLFLVRIDPKVLVKFVSSFSHSLESLRFSEQTVDYFYKSKTIFTSLVLLQNFNLDGQNMDNFPKATFFISCPLQPSFFNRSCGLLYKTYRDTGDLQYTQSENFDTQRVHDVVVLLDNFVSDSPYLREIQDCHTLYIEDKVKERDIPSLLSLIQAIEIPTVCVSSEGENLALEIQAVFPKIKVYQCG